MKYFLAALFISLNAYAGKGIIISLEAPILKEPSIYSKVLEMTKKGQRVFIHDKYFDPRREQEFEADKFYQTISKGGAISYIQKDYVKLLFNDSRELKKSAFFKGHDPTDYRIEEPLPPGFPLINLDKTRLMVNLGLGPAFLRHYPFIDQVLSESSSTRKGMNIIYTNRVPFDKTSRLHYGFQFSVFGQTSDFILKNNGASAAFGIDTVDARESLGELAIGPHLSYDVFRNAEYRLTLGGHIGVTYNRLILQFKDDFGANEERSFKGFSINPKISAYLQKKKFINKFDGVLGIEAHARLPHTLTPNRSPDIANRFWNEDSDFYSIPFSGALSFYLGFQASVD